MSLVPAVASGWRAGFGNALDKELGSWWRTRRWLIHLVMWPLIVGFFCFMVWADDRSRTPANGVDESVQLFFQLGGFFALIGAVLVTQGAIVGERRSGTAAWVLTKPLTRNAFVLAKLVGITFSFLMLSLVIPSLVWLVQIKLQWGQIPSLDHFYEAVGILAIHQFFFIALTLTLGTFFQHRAGVAGAALGFWIAGRILPGQLPEWLVALTPWPLVDLAPAVALWRPVPIQVWIPTLASAVLAVICVAIALWRFGREEF